MDEILKQVKSAPGVLGCMVCDDRGQLLSHVFPALFDKEMLTSAIATVVRNLPGLKDFTGGVRMIDFRYQSGRIVIWPIDGGFLVILCEGLVSLQALKIAVNVAVKQIEKTFGNAIPASQEVVVTPKSSPAKTPSPSELLDQGPLSTYLQGMQTTLAKYIGPMAKIIFLECLENWLKDHQPVKAALPQLVDIVAVEIGDPAKIADYRQKVATFI